MATNRGRNGIEFLFSRFSHSTLNSLIQQSTVAAETLSHGPSILQCQLAGSMHAGVTIS